MRRRRVVLDTDVASRILLHQLDLEMALLIKDAQWVVSFATVGELWQWAEVRQWGSPRRAELGLWLEELTRDRV